MSTRPSPTALRPAMPRMRLVFVLAVALGLGACASAPKPVAESLVGTQALETLRDEPHAQSARYRDAEALAALTRIAPPRVRVADGAAAPGISEAQAALVANRAARDVCNGLAEYFVLETSEGAPTVELVLTAIQPTSRGAAGASALFDAVVPGPFRLPAGLGALAAEGALRVDGAPVYLLRWSEGAGTITEGARVSTIGDAYQLANDFAKDFVKGLREPAGEGAAPRPRLDAASQAANDALCLARFGRASVAGRGASFLLPLAPEAIDAGSPDEAASAPSNDEEPVED